MQTVYRHEQHVIVPVYKLYGLLHLAVDTVLDQTAETSDTVIDMDDVVSLLKRVDIVHSKSLAPLNSSLQSYAPIAVKYLMVGIKTYLTVVVYESLLYRILHILKTKVK